MRRRTLLGTLPATALGGCLGTALPPKSALGDDDTPTDSAPTVDSGRREQICTTGRRLDVVRHVQYDTVGAFTIEADRDSVAIGETITVRMTNGAWSDRTIATRDHYDIQWKTGDGWRSVYTLEPDAMFAKIGRVLEARESLDWTVRLTQSALANDISAKDARAVVCSPLKPGQYRFVFFGLDNHTGSDLGVRFELTPADGDGEAGSDSSA